MKKTIIYLVVIFTFMFAQRAISQPIPTNGEAIKLLWEGTIYSTIVATNDGKYIFGSRTANNSTTVYQIDALTGTILDSIIAFKERNLHIYGQFSMCDSYEYLYAGTGTGSPNVKDSVYKYNLLTKEFIPLNIKYHEGHVSFGTVRISPDNKFLLLYESYDIITKQSSIMIIYDIQKNEVKSSFEWGERNEGITFNHKGDKFYTDHPQVLTVGEYSAETGKYLNTIDFGFTSGIGDLSISNDDKYLVVIGGLENNTAIYNLEKNSLEFKEQNSLVLPILLSDNKYMFRWHKPPVFDDIYDWKNKKIVFELPINIGGDNRYLRNNLLIKSGNEFKLQVYQLDYNVLDVAGTTPSGISVNYVDRGNSNYQIIINSDKYFKLDLQIVDITGKVFRKEIKQIKEGENIIDCNLIDLPIGTYLINLKADGINKTIKILKDRD